MNLKTIFALALVAATIAAAVYFWSVPQDRLAESNMLSNDSLVEAKTHALCQDCNVILVVIDTARADHFGAYGYPRNTTPNIDQLADGGFVFENAYTVRGSTWPSMTTMLTSKYPTSTGVRRAADVSGKKFTTLADVMNDSGYSTAGFISRNFCSSGQWGFEHKYCSHGKGGDGDLTKKALGWVSERKGEKFLALVHYFAPHSPYKPVQETDLFTDSNYTGGITGERKLTNKITKEKIQLSEADVNNVVSLYDGEIYSVDILVGRLMEGVRRLGIADKTVFVVTADHGEELHQRTIYFYHDCSIYDTALHIPFIINIPNVRGDRITTVAENTDFTPTILDVVGAMRLYGAEGKSMANEMAAGSPDGATRYAYSERYVPGGSVFRDGACVKDRKAVGGTIMSVTDGRWRYIYNPSNVSPSCSCLPRGLDYIVSTEELYDMSSDVSETRNVASDNMDLADSLRTRLTDKYAKPAVKGLRIRNKTVIRELESLGYIV